MFHHLSRWIYASLSSSIKMDNSNYFIILLYELNEIMQVGNNYMHNNSDQ